MAGNDTLQGVPSARGRRGLGFVGFDFDCFAVSPILLRLMGIWQKRLGSWASWWNTEIKVNPTQVYEDMGHTVYLDPNWCQSKMNN